MITQRGAGAALIGMALAISTVTACAPRESRAPIVEAGGAPGAAAGVKSGGVVGAQSGGAGAAVGPAAVDTLPPPATVAECRKRLQPLPASFPARPGNDPQTQLDDRFQAYHETFRCCFDVLHSPKSPRTSGHVALLVKVDYTGKLTSADIVAPETDIASPEVRACVIDTARTLPYPAPASNMDVAYKRVLEFQVRR